MALCAWAAFSLASASALAFSSAFFTSSASESVTSSPDSSTACTTPVVRSFSGVSEVTLYPIALGAHRAAWLLYTYRDRLAKDGVLVIGGCTEKSESAGTDESELAIAEAATSDAAEAMFAPAPPPMPPPIGKRFSRSISTPSAVPVADFRTMAARTVKPKAAKFTLRKPSATEGAL